MRKLTQTRVRPISTFAICIRFIIPALIFFMPIRMVAQCVPVNGTIGGLVYLEENFDGFKDPGESGQGNVMVRIYDINGNQVGEDIAGPDGSYFISGLSNGDDYRIEFITFGEFLPSKVGATNGGTIQFAQAPACDVSLGLQLPNVFCEENPTIGVSCFARGDLSENLELETLVGIEHDFDLLSQAVKYANKSETGSVWGIAWKQRTQELYSSAFLKQYATLSSHGLGAIFRTKIYRTGDIETNLLVDLKDLGIDAGTLFETNPNDCNYGALVLKTGLGALVISPDEEYLFVVNIHNNSIVRITVNDPFDGNHQEHFINFEGCADDEYRAFGMVEFEGKYYVTLTCTAETSKNSELSAGHVLEYNPESGTFTTIFSTNYLKGYWADFPSERLDTSHVLTDIAFTDEGNMVIGLADRQGHRWCNGSAGRTDQQFPDILMVWNDNGVWRLEENGTAGSYVGSGVGNGQGPGGGEFFGDDYWETNPVLHPEVALGSVFVFPGKGQVVAAVYDPWQEAYSGGLHRYNTSNGSITAKVELYQRSFTDYFGKGTGFGDLLALCGDIPIEIGNQVWDDVNNNGIQDPGETPFEGLEICLFDEDCQMVGQTYSDANGHYYFNETNVDLNGDGVFDGLEYESTYYIVVTDTRFNKATVSLQANGFDYVLGKKDNAEGDHADLIDSDVGIAQGLCSEINDLPYIEVNTLTSGHTNHSYDIAVTTDYIFDLALIKVLTEEATVAYGDTVTFQIFVFNQGNLMGQNIVVDDHINAGYIFPQDLNPQWISVGSFVKTSVPGKLYPGESTSVFIDLIIKPGASLTSFTNIAEIAAANDQFGNPGDDIDSTPDDDPYNDAGGIPNVPTDDTIDLPPDIDEDDHDPEIVRILDLALIKVIEADSPEFIVGQQVPYLIRIYNQGNEVAKNINIVDYLPEGFVFDPAENPDWFMDSDTTAMTTIAGPLSPGDILETRIKLGILPEFAGTRLINYAEIESAETLNEDAPADLDSKPNHDRDDDAGGDPETPFDNEIFLYIDDEDDHDGEQIFIDHFDLALIKTTDVLLVERGDLVTFYIHVINQGTLTADNIKLVDYLPEYTSLADPVWQLDPTDPDMERLCYLLSTDTGTLPLLGLLPADTVIVPITLQIDADAPLGPIVNIAEIVSATDITGNDITDLDEDSNFDTDDDNDMVIDDEILDDGTLDEDDHDPETIYVGKMNVKVLCHVLDNASNPDDGQFVDSLSIIGPCGLTWHISSASGVFNPAASLDPPNAPVPYMTGPGGYTLSSTPIGGAMCEYTLNVLHVDGMGYSIVLEDEQGDQQSFTNPGCLYTDPIISGPTGVCVNSPGMYCVENPHPDDTYHWSLSHGGFIAEDNGECIEIQWTTLGATGTISLVVTNPEIHYAPASLDVTVGQIGGPISCISYIQTSLDENCELVVTPELVITGTIDPLAVYSVMLTDEYGDPIPNATLTEEHIGQEITVKVIDDCGGNSCWATIVVEDKLPPVIECDDITINCWNMVNYTGPTIIENCSGPVQMEMIAENSMNLTCHPLHIKEFNRTYIATDASGNVSNECTQTITLRRINLDLVVFPDSFLISENRALTCGAYPVDAHGFPDPAATGVPTIEGLDLYPVSDLFCNIGVDYMDIDLPTSDCTRKIMRTWTVYEAWCTVGEIEQYLQLIEVEDNIPPNISCPDDITVSSGGDICGAEVLLPSASGTDNCTTDLQYDVSYNGEFLQGQNGGISVFFEAGTHEVQYTVSDKCYNSATCSIQITVVDETAPVAVCDQNTVVGLNLSGEAVVYAYGFDDGSFDDCYIDRMEVKRVGPHPLCDQEDAVFGEYITFCCDDVGEDIMVVLGVWDKEGNYNECLVNVSVQDKHPPIISCPDDITIYCEDDYDIEDLSEFGTASAFDQCSVRLDEVKVPNINSCGTGYIDRTFIARDRNGFSECTQRITIINPEPFNFDDITPPEDYETEAACDAGDLDPDSLDPPFDRPQLSEDECDLIGMSYQDFVFPIEDEGNSCLKIVRRWTIIDWCQPLEDDIQPWIYDQIIKVNNSVPPFIRLVVDAETCSFDDECEEGFVELEASATDDCTPGINLFWEVALDIDADGSIDSTWQGTGSLITADGYYPLGTHEIFFTFEDRCGNKVTESAVFSIINCKAPLAICIDGLAVAIEPMDTDGDGIADTEMAIICAEDFDASSVHPCGFPIKFTFDQECELECIPVDCNDIGIQIIQIWVTDIFGNQAFCETTVVVQDTNDEDICEDVDDCIIWPDAEVTVSECVPDFDPATIGSETTIDPDCICSNYEIEWVDNVSTDDNGCTEITRRWTVTFNCGIVKQFFFTQTIHILNDMAPDITCPADVTASATNGNCEAEVSIPIPTVDGPCNSGYTITHNSVYADAPGENASGTYPVGMTTVVFTVTDDCGNSSTCDVKVTVGDGSPPICITRDITIQLDPDGTASITAGQINNGSSDDCGTITNLDLTPTNFDCDDIGTNIVTLTVTDDSGNISDCTATVTIEDNIAPECVALDITVMLDEQGMATIQASQLDGGSEDICGMSETSFEVSQDNFDCDDLGDVSVVLTVSDLNGNTSTCEATVTIVDEVAPVCVPQDITIMLNPNSMVSIEAIDVDGGSFDLCGNIIDLDVTPSVFDCNDIGNNTVTLTVTDESGNTSSCTATVTIEDSIAPECLALDITVMLDEQGMATIQASQLDGGSEDICGMSEISFEVSQDNFDCDDVGDVSVVLTVSDLNGNTSTCEATVTIVDEVAPVCVPQDITVMLNVNGMVSIDGVDVDGGSFDLCGDIIDLDVTPSVFDCNTIGNNTVTLTVTDESGNTSSCTATVTIEDPLAPICVPQDITVMLNDQGMATIIANDVDGGSSDACGGGDVSIEIDQTDFTCADIGVVTVTLTVTDDNDNSSTCEAMVTVQDQEPPDCIAQDVTLYLDEMGMASVTPAEIDNGSSDACGSVTDLTLSQENFNCSEIGTNMVTLTVTDDSSNSSTCNANVTVLDTLPPVCVVTDITLFLDENGETSIDPDVVGGNSFDNCDADVDLEVFPGNFFCNDAGTRGFTLTVTDNQGNTAECEGTVTVLDTIPPELICPIDLTIDCSEIIDDLDVFGMATSNDECGLSGQLEELVVIDVDDCGLGTIVRTFTSTDNSGNVSQCSQLITITLGDDPIGLDDITAPTDTVFVEDCSSIDPIDLPGSEPVVDASNADCSNVSIDFSDMSITGGNTCPDTILRVWTLIDSCQLVQGSQSGIFNFDQILVIEDTNEPVLSLPSDMTLFLPEDICELFVDLPGTVTDCDLNPTVTNDSPFADNSNSVDASGTYPDGVHTITVTATDACSNMSTGSYSLTLLDTVPPTLECFKIVANIQDDGMILVSVDSLLAKLEDNCTDSLEIMVSFSKTDPFETTRIYDCSFLMGNAVRDDTTFLYAFDNAMNFDSCKTIITVSDIEGGFCGGNLVNIFGQVQTELLQPVNFVSVALDGSELDDEVTGDDGKYTFRNMPMGNSYTVHPEKDMEPLNGVSTLDIIFIQKHILGIELLDSPYKQIAADINNSRSVTASDMVELRKLILGIYDDFPDNTSWRMIDTNYDFYDPEDAFADPIPESHFIPILDQSLSVDFVGLKVGDVNGSADPAYFNSSEVTIRSKPFVFDFEILQIKDDYVQLDVYAEEFKAVEGFQFTLDYPSHALEFVKIQEGHIMLNSSNVGVHSSDKSKLTFSWNGLESVTKESDQILFSMIFKSNQEYKSVTGWDLNSDLTVAEVYEQGSARSVFGRFRLSQDEWTGYSLSQNAPNPWSEMTSIIFELPEETNAEISIYNVTGERIYHLNDKYPSGKHVIEIRKDDLDARGVLYYELKTKDVNLVRKMLHIK